LICVKGGSLPLPPVLERGNGATIFPPAQSRVHKEEKVMALLPRKLSLFDDGFFDDFWAPRATDRDGKSLFAPVVDIKDKKDHYEITAEMPGVKKEDIKVTVDDGVLTIEAESTQEDKEEKEGRIIRQERRYGRYMRSFNLGGEVQAADISASFEDGVLRLRAPKAEEKPAPQRRIEIS
jgi:HSP20 family protein